jgi:hypothetical protein
MISLKSTPQLPDPAATGRLIEGGVVAATPSEAQASLTALLATGLRRWDAMLALVEAGVEPGLFPELAGLTAENLKIMAFEGPTVWPDGVLEATARRSSEQANALLGAWLEGATLPRAPRLEYEHWITALPAGVTVGGDLLLKRSGITTLSPGLRVEGMLDLRYTQVSELPEGISAQVLDLGSTRIRSLPRGLRLERALDLTGCRRWDGKIPEDAEVGRMVITDRHPQGITLEGWRERYPEGEPNPN